MLQSPLMQPLHPRRRVDSTTAKVIVRGARRHNLRAVDAAFPLERLTVVTGVSGSGKSTLARDVLLANLQTIVGQRNPKEAGVGCAAIEGWRVLDRVLEVDQTPIGKTPRSCPATYVGFWDAIRRLYAETLEARTRGYGASRFSSQHQGRSMRCVRRPRRAHDRDELSAGRQGSVRRVPVARGSTRNAGNQWRDKSIGDVHCDMKSMRRSKFFCREPVKFRIACGVRAVGLGYLTLGQPSPTLSGGEAQRIKLVAELAKVRDDLTRAGQRRRGTLYVLDEPTVGLHMAERR